MTSDRELIKITKMLDDLGGESIYDYIKSMVEAYPLPMMRDHIYIDFDSFRDSLRKFRVSPKKRAPGLEFTPNPDIRKGWAVIPDVFNDESAVRVDESGQAWRPNEMDFDDYLPTYCFPGDRGEVMLKEHWDQLVDFAMQSEDRKSLLMMHDDGQDW